MNSDFSRTRLFFSLQWLGLFRGPQRFPIHWIPAEVPLVIKRPERETDCPHSSGSQVEVFSLYAFVELTFPFAVGHAVGVNCYTYLLYGTPYILHIIRIFSL